VVGAAMELRARLGIGERGKESGSESRERVLCEVGMRGRGNFVYGELLDCLQIGSSRALGIVAPLEFFQHPLA
jgi:hypothetical protein